MKAAPAITVKPDKTRLLNLLEEITSGNIQIPVFQRDFVWRPDQMIDLFDSIVKGYPIGSLLFWKPEATYETKEFIGPYKAGNIDGNVLYVLDGYQRITSLFSVLSNPKNFDIHEDHDSLRNFRIYYNLKKNEFSHINKHNDHHTVPLYRIIDTFEFIDLLQEIQTGTQDKTESNKLIDTAKRISKIFYDYEIPYVEIKGGDIKSAVEIFSRINSTGTEISEDFMISALSYNHHTNFLLSDSITEFLISLKKYGFDNLKRNIVLDCIASTTGKFHYDVKLEEILRFDLENTIEKSFGHIRKAISFLYEKFSIVDIKLLPYANQLIFISEYFRKNPSPSDIELLKLENWFWTTSYSSYFTILSISQQRRAHKEFIDFAEGKSTDGIFKVNSDQRFDSLEFPDRLNFIGVRSKTLQLFMLKRKGSPRHNESVKEVFFFDKKGRMPANMVILLGSDFSHHQITDGNSIINLETADLSGFFLDESLKHLYMQNNVDRFISERQTRIMDQERKHVEHLGISYTSTGII